MKLKHLLLTALMTVVGIGSSWADTNKLTPENGWQKVTNLSSLNIGDYYFAFVDDSRELMLSLGWSFHQSVENNYRTFVYRSAEAAEMNPNMLWTLEAYDGGYNIKNAEYQSHFLQTEWNAAWYCRTHDNGGGDKSWGKWNLTLNDGKYLIENGKYTGNWIGPWDTNSYVNGSDVAGNKTASQRGLFQIYAIAKTAVNWQGNAAADRPANVTFKIVNPDFECGKDNLHGWTNSGEIALGGQGNKSLSNMTGLRYVEAYHKSGTLDLNQTLKNMPKGTYKLTAVAQTTDGKLYANDENVAVNANATYEVFVNLAAEGDLKIGYSATDNGSKWTAIDNVQLYYYGDVSIAEVKLAAYVSAYKAALKAAQDVYANTYLPSNSKEELYGIILANTVDLNNTTQSELETAASNLNAAAVKYGQIAAIYQGVAGGAGSDLTGALINPSFETGNMDGWTNNSATGMWKMMTRGEAADPKVGAYWIEKYGVAGKLDISQTISNMPAGIYRVTVLTLDQASLVKLVANDKETAVNGGTKAVYTVYVKLNAGDNLKLGLYCENHTKDKWVGADDFHLTYVGADYPEVVLTTGLLYNKHLETAQSAAKAVFDADPTPENYDALVEAAAAAKAEKDYEEAQVARTTAALASNSIATNVIDGWRCTNAQVLHVNTWSGEGATDGSNMTTPFIENWVAAGGLLGDGEISFLMVGLTPGDTYSFSALGRAIIEKDASATLKGIKMFANETEIDLTEQGEAKSAGENSLVYGTFTLEGTVNEDGVLAVGFKINETNCNWLAFKNVKFGKLIDIKKAELKDALDALVVPTANVGDGAFLYPTDEIAELNIAKITAQAVYDDPDATVEQVAEQIDAIQTLELPALNAPAAGKKFHLAIKYNGYRYDGHALNLSSNGVAVPLADRTANNNYPNDWTFTSVAGTKDGYTFSLTDENGTHYVCTGAQDNGNSDVQIRFTDDEAKALTIVVKPTNTEGVYTFLNTRSNNTSIGCQDDRESDGGWYTTGSHNTHTIVEATQAAATLNVTAAKYGTFVAPFAAEVPEGVTVYSCDNVSDSKLTLAAVNEIKANTAYIVYAESATTKNLAGWGLATKDTYASGLLTGVYTATPAPEGSYVLQNNNNHVGFYRVGETKPTVGANRAYLKAPASQALAFFFDTETAIQAVNALTTGEAEIYDLNGVKQQSLQKGINIVKLANGKTQKVLVK